MPQTERPEEWLACSVVARDTGRAFTFTDLTGGVDYTCADGNAVLEVTRFTRPLLRRDMAEASQSDHVMDLGTGFDWWLSFSGYPRYRGLVQRLYPVLLAMETHGLRRYDESQMSWWLRRVPTLRDAASALVAERLFYAQGMPAQQQPSRMFVVVSGGWVYGGPDAALALLERAVEDDEAHRRKLAVVSAPERHLWLWTDVATTEQFRRAMEEARLPTRDPVLPPEVTHLWCVDEQYRRGWRWTPATGWTWVTVD